MREPVESGGGEGFVAEDLASGPGQHEIKTASDGSARPQALLPPATRFTGGSTEPGR
ncbi:hypothetical protein ACQ4WX_41560 [Streptomyces lasalocidi]